jgi:hypothetical protein
MRSIGRFRTVIVAGCAASCGTRPAATPPPAPAAAPTAIDAGAVAEVKPPPPPPPAPPDPLAGKSPDEQWAWALSLVPSLSEVVRRPTTASFAPLGLKKGAITLYAPRLELALARKQPAPCLALPFKLEDGELATRVALDGSRARPDLKDRYVILRLGVTIFDHESVEGEAHGQYADASIGGTLSEVGPRGLRYDGDSDSVVVICQKSVIKHECRDGSSKVCELCNPIAEVRGAGVGGSGVTVKSSACDPCPPDPVAPHIDAINRVLQQQPAMRIDKESGAAFYTHRADCKAALRGAR